MGQIPAGCKMKKLAEFKCFVGLLNGKLHLCRLVNAWPEFTAGRVNWVEVKSPVTKEFLDAANASLETNFLLEDFTESGQGVKLEQRRKITLPPTRGESRQSV